ncbi:MAG TPA: S8 family serine peptidase [Pyrinomonadaceae bacterium]|nr:S8 family serine peptidase [Pyrinomonadaceae bacterium]
MRRYTSILIVLSAVLVITGMYTTTGQEPALQDDRVKPDLRQELSRAKPDEFVRAIIRLKGELPPAERAKALAYKDKKQRRDALTAALKQHAERSQRALLGTLKELQGRGVVRNVKSLWISNVIGLEIQPRALEAILRHKEIEYLKQDVKRPALQAPSWNISHIHADSVWALPTPYTGTGVVVAVLDTGIDLDHPDLVNRLWINAAEDTNSDGQFTAADNNGVDNDGNGYIDDVVGWDLANNDNSPDDWHGHGTHCAGTVAGDGTGGTATGVAPGARLMALGYSASIVAGQTEAWEGMQYALDNGADIVSFSSGWKDAWSPDYATWRQNTDNLTDAGVLFVVAAGNDGPHVAAPGDVLTPARAPRALALGATDNTDAIAGFSGTGPSSWQTVTGYNDYIWPPGLMKPDVSAPGVSVLSTQNGGGYVNGAVWSGTSMATPHASGLAALLLQKNPALLPHELAFIIRHTAVDLGSVGPDNVYGWGRIDALAAVNYTYPTSPVYDLSVTGTNAVWTTADIWVDNNDDGTPEDPIANQNNHLYARIRNIGEQAVGNVEIKFYYADVGTIGISGFDPNNDGDPADGNFNYIGSYFVPVVGPQGTPQGTTAGVVNWNVPVPVTDHWCVGIGIVAPNPPNATEANRINNRAFKNFFNIIVALSEVRAFQFFVYPDPRRPGEPFDLEFVRRGLPRDFEVELGVPARLAERWFREPQGFERVKPERLKNLTDDLVLQGERDNEEKVRLAGDRGVLRQIAVPDGKPVLVRLTLRTPRKQTAIRRRDPNQLLVINALNQQGAFGGLSLNVKLKEPQR